jgi:3,4-dihydroxyphenylacetate 2,3-dioxygenase
MTAASDLVGTPPASPPYDILRAAFAELQVTDLEASEHFYVDLLGMIVSDRTADALYLRGWEERLHHSLILRRSPVAAAARLAFRMRSEADLDLLAAGLSQQGLTLRWIEDHGDPGMGRALRAWDPFGDPLEFFHQMEQVETQLQRFDLHRGAPILRLDHFNLHTPRVEEAFRFWLGLGFRCSEYISTDGADERITGAWLLRKPSVHDVALTAGRGPRLHHTAFWIGEPAGVLRACDQLAAAGRSHAIERGPGRHGVSNAFFVYLRDPDGHRIELYSCDYYTGDPDHKPIRWSVTDPRCRSFWGTRAPDSWYEESSIVLGPDGEPMPTAQANVDERDQRSEVLA